MTREEREKWESRYRAGQHSGLAPDPGFARILRRACDELPPEKRHAVDLAAGDGRYSELLRELGFRVDAFDLSWQGLRRLRRRVATPEIRAAVVELDSWRPRSAPWSLVVVSDFLDRALLASLHTWVGPKGLAAVSLRVRHPENEGFRFAIEEPEAANLLERWSPLIWDVETPGRLRFLGLLA